MEEEIMKENAIQLVEMMAEKDCNIDSVKSRIKEIVSKNEFKKEYLIFELEHEKIQREYKILKIEYDAFKDLVDIRLHESKNKKVSWKGIIGIVINDVNNMKKELNRIFDELYKMVEEV